METLADITALTNRINHEGYFPLWAGEGGCANKENAQKDEAGEAAARRGEGGFEPRAQREKKLGQRQKSAALRRRKSKCPAWNVLLGFQGPQKMLTRAKCQKTIASFLPTSNNQFVEKTGR